MSDPLSARSSTTAEIICHPSSRSMATSSGRPFEADWRQLLGRGLNPSELQSLIRSAVLDAWWANRSAIPHIIDDPFDPVYIADLTADHLDPQSHTGFRASRP